MDALSLLKRKESFDLLKQLPNPENIWKYFLLCTETPRPSHKLDKFRKVLTDLAPVLDCEYKIDTAGNVRFRKKASKGYENAPKICIQSHMDMVTSANGDISINFDTDPINVFLTNKNKECWMQAKGTTLGADNGMGVATALALFEDSKLGKFNHGQLEALFTADEETTMGGAEFLNPKPFLDSDILLNVDSEEEYSICIGCAGGMENSFNLPIERKNLDSNNYIYYNLHLKGLLGGHSGIEIHTGRGNSLKILNKILRQVSNSLQCDIYIISFIGGGAPNVIPRESEAIIAISSKYSSDNIINEFNLIFNIIKELYLSVEHRIIDNTKQSVMILDINILSNDKINQKPLSLESSQKLLDSIELFYSGVIRMNFDVKDLVETSINFSNVQTEQSHVSFYSFARSSSNNALDQVQDSLEAYARLIGANVTKPLNKFPGWDPNIDSLSLLEMKKAHKEIMGCDARVYAVHAGLECGLIQAVYPDISCISIGPEIHHAHSPDECLLVPSVKRYYDLVIKFIERIANSKQ